MARKTNASNLEGRDGNVVYYQSYGKQCVRTVAQHIKNPRTPAQQLQRAKFSAVTQWLQPIRDAIRIGYADGNKGYHFGRAVKELLKNAIVTEGDEPRLEASLAKVAVGELATMENAECLPNNGQQPSPVTHHPSSITIKWTPNKKSVRSHIDDQMVWLLYDEGNRHAITNAMQALKPKRNSGTCLIDLSNAKAGTYHLYAFFTNNKMTHSSDSVYLGEVTI